MMDKLRNDGNPIEETTVKEVKEWDNSFQITREDGWCFGFDKKWGITPHVGDKLRMKTWGTVLGQIMGIEINGTVAYDKTNEELEAERQVFLRNYAKDKWNSYREWKEKAKDDPPFETIDISGMSGGYEATCQRMLYAGLKFLDEHPDFKFNYEQSENIVGIAIGKTEWTKLLDDILEKAADHDCTGAMNQFVVNHLAFIYKNGKQKWLDSAPAERRYTYPQGLPPPTDEEPT
jgi:hypothetical protein